MNQNVCYYCGSALFEQDGRWICSGCNSYIGKEDAEEDSLSSDLEFVLLATAFQTLRLMNFYDAEQEFEDIIRKFPHNAQGYWGHLLSKYGIKYEEDYDGKIIPTCYAASIESVYDSPDYKKAMEYADEELRNFYRSHAEYIERVRREWVQKASKEQPYDIFISYKDSDLENGLAYTADRVTMQDLYLQLTKMGYRVFFSHESLRNKTGEKYEPYIFNALATAKVMLVYGSKPEYFTSTWVKNEWTRYIKRMKAGEKKAGSLIVAYEKFPPKELPGALTSLQCLNAGEKRFYTDLFAAIERILGGGIAEEKPVSAPSVNESGILCHHDPMTIPGKPATCTENGWTETVLCKLCGEMLKKAEILPTTGHRFGEWRIAKKATCTEDGEYESVCSCGERKTKPIPSRGGHLPGNWETAKKPAPGKDGLKVRKCVLCGARVEEEKIPALPARQANAPARQANAPTQTPRAPQAQKAPEGLKYKVNKDGKTCTILGQGTCKNTNLVIPEAIDGYRVMSIGDDAFADYTNLESVVIPNSVTSIGREAFIFCTSLESVVIPNSVTSIGREVFHGCTSLASVVIPNSVTSIGSGSFFRCTSLASVDIPNSVTSIGNEAFSFCESLASAVIPDSVTIIDNTAFIGAGKVSVSKNNPNYLSVDGNLYTKDGKTLLHYAANKKETSFTVPDSVTSIGYGAFNGCTSLASVVIPNSVKSIGSEAFFRCESLANIRYKGTKKQWEQIEFGSDWRANSSISHIKCKLGTIQL